MPEGCETWNFRFPKTGRAQAHDNMYMRIVVHMRAKLCYVHTSVRLHVGAYFTMYLENKLNFIGDVKKVVRPNDIIQESSRSRNAERGWKTFQDLERIEIYGCTFLSVI